MRGEVYRQMGRYQEALNDFDRSIALDEKYGWAITRRQATEQQMKHTQDEKELASGNNGDLEDPTIRVAPSWATTVSEDSTSAPPIHSHVRYDFRREPPIPIPLHLSQCIQISRIFQHGKIPHNKQFHSWALQSRHPYHHQHYQASGLNREALRS